NMPGMNGYDLARNIRALELAHGKRRTPIIAYTANTLGGVIESCFAAGMDDYLAKPVELVELLKKIDHWLPIGLPGPLTFKLPIEAGMLAANVGEDAATQREMLWHFRRANDADAAVMKAAVDARDLPRSIQSSHRIRGASLVVGATGLAAVCETLETAARAGDWEAIVAAMVSFDAESERLALHLDGLAA
ncbi:MAG: response regulator, partial [Usitatibacter sp.]